MLWGFAGIAADYKEILRDWRDAPEDSLLPGYFIYVLRQASIENAAKTWHKSAANCGAHLPESNFQTHSGAHSRICTWKLEIFD